MARAGAKNGPPRPNWRPAAVSWGLPLFFYEVAIEGGRHNWRPAAVFKGIIGFLMGRLVFLLKIVDATTGGQPPFFTIFSVFIKNNARDLRDCRVIMGIDALNTRLGNDSQAM